jgi:hypothetical protein
VDDPALVEGRGRHPALDALDERDVLHLQDLVDVPDGLDLGGLQVAGLED